jgi:hypothetical protein
MASPCGPRVAHGFAVAFGSPTLRWAEIFPSFQ